MSTTYECLSWATLLLLAQWFFGNLYEAVTFVPNVMSFIESKSRTGEALFRNKRTSPVAYYVPASSMALVLGLILAITGWLRHNPGTPYILASCGLLIAGVGLTLYVVRYINLDLFFRPQADLVRARKMLRSWAALNYVRLTIAAASVITTILWTRTIVLS